MQPTLCPFPSRSVNKKQPTLLKCTFITNSIIGQQLYQQSHAVQRLYHSMCTTVYFGKHDQVHAETLTVLFTCMCNITLLHLLVYNMLHVGLYKE